MKNLPFLFIFLASLFALGGMALGIYMGMAQDHSLAPAHAHNNLIGWVTMALYGFYYKAVPSAASDRLAAVHFWLALLGSLTIGVGIAFAETTGWIVQIASLATILGMLLFAVIVWRHRSALTSG